MGEKVTAWDGRILEKLEGLPVGRPAEDWARGQGCIEMASDTRIDNAVSQRAHQALGFEVAEHSVLYRKTL